MAANIAAVTDADFHAEVIESDGPVLVDFWATWCPPCKVMDPILEAIDAEQEDLRVVSLDVDDNAETTAAFEVLSMPTFILFRDGREVQRFVGARPKQRFEAELRAALVEEADLAF